MLKGRVGFGRMGKAQHANSNAMRGADSAARPPRRHTPTVGTAGQVCLLAVTTREGVRVRTSLSMRTSYSLSSWSREHVSSQLPLWRFHLTCMAHSAEWVGGQAVRAERSHQRASAHSQGPPVLRNDTSERDAPLANRENSRGLSA